MNISVLSELERYKVQYSWTSDTDVRVHCPFHADSTPSLSLSVKKAVWKCHGCQEEGDFVKLLGGITQQPRSVILEDLATRYELDDTRIVEPSTVERWHGQIWSAPGLLRLLADRAITPAIIQRRKLGEEGGRVTIPIDNERGDWVNVRKYLPGAPSKDKMRNMRGRGSARFYPVDQLKFPAVMLCGGEVKALAAIEQLNRHGVGAVCVTQGEKLLPPTLLKQLAGKEVYVCMDVDRAGREASADNCRALHGLASEVFEVLLPLDLEKHPKGDVNDFIAGGGDLWALLQDLEQWTPQGPGGADAEPSDLALAEACNARHAGRRVRVRAVVSMMDTAPYIVPREVRVKCDRSQPFCALCPVHKSRDDATHVIGPESPSVLETVAVSKVNIRQAVMSGVGIPLACRVCEVEVLDYYNAEDVRLQPQLEITSRASDRTMQPAVCIGPGLEANEAYQLTGRMWPNPKTQQSTLLISSYETAKDALSTYEAHDLHELRLFQPREPRELEAIAEKLGELYDDLEANVTHVYGRRPLHMAIDLSYHSPLFVPWDGAPVKGWTEVLVVGDSSQGKSEAACGSGTPGGMLVHYGLGTKVECKNATAAGLMGGLLQMNGRWFVNWGVLPQNDKRHVTLEELKGCKPGEFGKLTDMRSSGIAELAKIEKRRTYSRTRLLAISNPPEGTLATYPYGVQACLDLCGAPEDLRRFDMAIVLAKGEVDLSVINTRRADRQAVEHRHTSDLCRRLVLWTWTRAIDQVVVSQETEAEVLRQAVRLADTYSEAIPLIDRGSVRHKLLRLSAALAGRLFSSDETGTRLVVLPCHVQYVAALLDSEYSKPSMGYQRYSDAQRAQDSLADEGLALRAVETLPHPRDVAQAMLQADRIESQDVMDWTGTDPVESRQLISQLVRQRALVRDGRSYRKTAPFVALLRAALERKDFGKRPDHVTQRERF